MSSFYVNSNEIQKYLLQSTLNPLLQNVKKPISEPIDFSKDPIKIEKTLVTINSLPKSRYGETNEPNLTIFRTDLQEKIDAFLERFMIHTQN